MREGGTSGKSETGMTAPESRVSSKKAASAAEGVSSKSSKREKFTGGKINEPIADNRNQAVRPMMPQQNLSHLQHGVGIQYMSTVVPPKTNQTVYAVELQPPKIRQSILESQYDGSISSKNEGVKACCINSTHNYIT